MPDDSFTPISPSKALTQFTPVPREKPRSNGWTAQVQRAFIEALADTGSVKAAARAVGRAPEGAYQLRRHPQGAEFAAAWAAALAHGVQRIEDVAMDRALNGVEVPVYSYGKLVGTRVSYNDRLLMFILRNRAPDRFAAGGGPRALNAVGRQQVERLKQQWLQERWAEEKEDEQEILAELEEKFATMAANRKANMSPAQREHEIAAAAQARADEEAGWTPGTPYREFAAGAAELLPQFLAEVEAEWPPLPGWAWDDENEDEEAEQGDAPPTPPPPAEVEEEKPEPPSGPRIRSIKDGGW